ncbi:cupredoxin domain-containing protein [Gulosibacter chungangensis]|uniref:Amicyanin n=1 Tax=Gulosibacter chungangensis TaxID=979746 RepID=A0A7J5B8C0_9MICO|nr:cupredoxin domain-containing protein [Gulosibacter chungangensis]KAB1641455.1 amicyanin [Gulosibacter chungangensis]
MDTDIRRILVHALGAVVTVGLLGGLAACAASKPEVTPSADDADPAVTVRAYDNAYDMPEVDVTEGEAVRWVFEGQNEHDVVAGDASFVSELMRQGSFTHVFDEAGSYEYDCSIHAEMKGVVNVTAD